MSEPSRVERFASRYAFSLDPFQLEALHALDREESVLVAAPTGSGKTVVGEFAVWLALEEGKKAFYTTPLKALSNQKFADLAKLAGPDNVGLLTGDNSINPHASVLVMTTEVLRNMIYERSALLAGLSHVVLDEVHYLQDPYRGAVWEEVIIHLPQEVKIVSLSATVSNAEEFSDWIQTLRGPTKAVIETSRPVELRAHCLIERTLYPMFTTIDGKRQPNAEIARVEAKALLREDRRPRSRAKAYRPRPRFPDRTQIVELLRRDQMLPAIYFIFSRKGCSLAVAACIRDGLVLTDGAERAAITRLARERCAYLDPQDLEVLGYSQWLDALSNGIAAHHAGLIPVFKEAVEELFQRGLVKVVFATETLSLGINMPARTVVIESLSKFSGERHEILTPGEFTQLTGRAGRRGIDEIGHAVVPTQRDIPFHQVAGLASATTYPLLSSFQPSYNMATNLIKNYSRDQAHHLLNSSFAQYRADKDVVVLEQLIEKNEAYLTSYREKMHCDKGDFQDYWLRFEHLRSLDRIHFSKAQQFNRDAVRRVLATARPADVLFLDEKRQTGPVVVIAVETTKAGAPVVIALSRDRRVLRLGPNDFRKMPVAAGNLVHLWTGEANRRQSKRGTHSIDHQLRRKLAGALDNFEIPGSEPSPESVKQNPSTQAKARQLLQRHPCHGCPDRDRHSQWAEKASRLEQETSSLRKKINTRTQTLSLRFERILKILEEYGYVRNFELSDKGSVLAKIYNENDLLVTEAVSRDWLRGLQAQELAALVSTFVFQSRGPFELEGQLPGAASKKAYGKIARLSDKIKENEANAGLQMTRGVEPGFAHYVYRWCVGDSLENVIDEDTTPGDFIRSCKQTLDLLRQLRGVEDDPVVLAALGESVRRLDRGVVAYSNLV